MRYKYYSIIYFWLDKFELDDGQPQSLEQCLAAVQYRGYLLEHVQHQTPEICMAAVQENAYALQFVREQTPEICKAAARKWHITSSCFLVNGKPEPHKLNWYIFDLIKPQYRTPEICLAAVQHCGLNLRHVHQQTPELCLAAVQQHGFALAYVIEQTPEICLAAVQQNGHALHYAVKQTPELCIAALRQAIDENRVLRIIDSSIFDYCVMKQNGQAFAEKLAAYVFHPVRLQRIADRLGVNMIDVLAMYDGV